MAIVQTIVLAALGVALVAAIIWIGLWVSWMNSGSH